jgi:hypothetical protein
MEYKYIGVSDSVSIPVPLGLTPDEEANFIAGRLAFVNLKELEAEYEEAMRLSEEGKLIPLREVLDELEKEMHAENGKPS